MPSNLPDSSTDRPHRPWLAGLGLALVAVLSLPPLLLERPPVGFVPAWASPLLGWAARAAVLAAMGLALACRAALDRRDEPRAGRRVAGFAVLALLLTAMHWILVDRQDHAGKWQRVLYLDILNHTHHDTEGRPDPDGALHVPHQFRPLPYGFVRTLEWVTGDWEFACLAYRWFFTFWLVWAWYRFARLFHPPGPAVLTLLVLPFLYPLSVLYYLGQLTDPLSHSLFVLALIYVIQDRPVALAASLALGVLAKETVVLVVPVYWACTWRQGLPALGKATGAGLACVAAFLAARLPHGWWPGYGSINGTTGLMVGTNLGVGEPLYHSAAPSVWHHYLHVLLFVGVFLPFVALHWRRGDRRLRVIVLTLTPLLLLSNLCFGWLYESRNYVPLLPVLTTMALPGAGGRRSGAEEKCPV